MGLPVLFFSQLRHGTGVDYTDIRLLSLSGSVYASL